MGEVLLTEQQWDPQEPRRQCSVISVSLTATSLSAESPPPEIPAWPLEERALATVDEELAKPPWRESDQGGDRLAKSAPPTGQRLEISRSRRRAGMGSASGSSARVGFGFRDDIDLQPKV